MFKKELFTLILILISLIYTAQKKTNLSNDCFDSDHQDDSFLTFQFKCFMLGETQKEKLRDQVFRLSKAYFDYKIKDFEKYFDEHQEKYNKYKLNFEVGKKEREKIISGIDFNPVYLNFDISIELFRTTTRKTKQKERFNLLIDEMITKIIDLLTFLENDVEDYNKKINEESFLKKHFNPKIADDFLNTFRKLKIETKELEKKCKKLLEEFKSLKFKN